MQAILERPINDSLRTVALIPTLTAQPVIKPANVFIAVPCYGNLYAQAMEGLMLATFNKDVVGSWTMKIDVGSLLGYVFNRMWCKALNTQPAQHWDKFAMHHSDIEAPAGWLDTLIQEQQRCGADVLSVVVPIKDERGTTSTAIRHESGHIRRFTMKQIHDLPETFDGEMAGCKPGEQLVVNTGLWVCNFDTPWAKAFPGFRVLDQIVYEDGHYIAKILPEDWGFSVWCHQQGLKVMATRKIKVTHHGQKGYCNDHVWGTLVDTDPGDKQ